MKYLLEVTENYRVDTENEVKALIDEAKSDNTFVLTKYNCLQKEKKQKGEVIDSWFKVSLTKRFCDEKEPGPQFTVSYSEE